jgi:hypothetical protein
MCDAEAKSSFVLEAPQPVNTINELRLVGGAVRRPRGAETSLNKLLCVCGLLCRKLSTSLQQEVSGFRLSVIAFALLGYYGAYVGGCDVSVRHIQAAVR